MVIGEKVIIRALKRDDAQLILKWVNNPKLRYLTGTLYPVSDVEHEKWFEYKLDEKVDKVFGIQDSATESLIGIIGLKNNDLINRSAELYTYIGDEMQWGKGLGTDAVRTFIRFAFDELNLHRVSLEVFSYNSRAISAYEKVGFITEGIMRESHFKDGKYHDKILMAILNDK